MTNDGAWGGHSEFAPVQELLARYQLLVEHARDIILFIRQRDGQILDANRVALRAYRYERHELLGLTIYDLRASVVQSMGTERIDGAENTNVLFEALHRRKDSSCFPVEVSSCGAEIAGEQILVSIVRDISERKQAEKAIRRYADRLQALRRIDMAIFSAGSTAGIAGAALAALRELTGCRSASLVCLTAYAATVVAVDAEDAAGVAVGRPVSVTAWDLAGRDGQVTRLTDADLARGTVLGQVVPLAGVSLVIALSVMTHGSETGVLFLGYDGPRTETPDAVEIAREISDQLALAMDQASLRQTLLDHSQQLERRVAERTAELSQKEAALAAANQSLQEVAERLRELDRMKSQFVSNVSHELRTPLSNMKLYLELLRYGQPAKREQYMNTLEHETGLLQRLIDDLLQLSRLDLDRAQPDMEVTDAGQLVKSLLDDRAALVARKELSLQVHISTQLPPVLVDPRMLAQVISNLVTNATNYTPAGGTITISVEASDGDAGRWVTIAVEDTGAGITVEDKKRLFERFFRGKAAQTRHVPGTGLGLAICQEIVRRHDGKITVESEPGSGSTFTVWLPARAEGQGGV